MQQTGPIRRTKIAVLCELVHNHPDSRNILSLSLVKWSIEHSLTKGEATEQRDSATHFAKTKYLSRGSRLERTTGFNLLTRRRYRAARVGERVLPGRNSLLDAFAGHGTSCRYAICFCTETSSSRGLDAGTEPWFTAIDASTVAEGQFRALAGDSL